MLLPSTTSFVVLLSTIQHAYLSVGTQVPLQSHPGSDISHVPVLDDEFDAWINETGNIWGMKGVAIAVTRKNKYGDGWTTETKGYGEADRWGNPVDEETLFAIGSNSKVFTALGVGLLTANESIPIRWDTKIKDILPSSVWALQDPIAQDHANLIDILSHRTGLPRHDLSYSRTDTVASTVAKLRYLRPSAEFRETFQYNNQMYILAAHIISQLTGTPFSTYITRNIISPLGLNSTTYNVTKAERSGKLAEGFLATGKDEDKGQGSRKLRFKPVPFWSKKIDSELTAGAGGVISNVKDMATWLQALLLLGKSPATGETVIPASVVEKVAQGVTILFPEAPAPELSPYAYGMGLGRYTYQGHELIEHDGSTVGHHSVVTRSPYDNLGIAVLINSYDVGPLLELIKFKLLEKSLGLKHIDWSERYSNMKETTEVGNLTERFPRPSDGTPSTLPYYDLAGVYFNPAYGTLTLCAYPPSSRTQPSRKECQGLLSEALKPFLNESVPALVVAWPKIWSTHVIIRHVSGNQFDVSQLLAFPAPFSDPPDTDEDSRPFGFPVPGIASAEFVFHKRPGEVVERVEGISCRGAWGPGSGVESPKGDGREGAEIWFDRVV